MLLTACDQKYLPEAKILIKSCARHEPDQRFYLYLVGINRDEETTISSWHPKIIVDKGTWPYHSDPRPGMINCIRSIALEKVLKKYHEPSVYLDSDTILRGPLTKLFEILESYDLSVKYRPELKQRGVVNSPHASTFSSGIIAIRPSDEGIQFASEYNIRVHSQDQAKI